MNRLLAVGVAAIAACIGGATQLSSIEQPAIIIANGAATDLGTTTVGVPKVSDPIVLQPATVLDDDMIMSITKAANCSQWQIAHKSLPARVYCDPEMKDAETDACTPSTVSFTATFTPTGPAESTCLVTVEYESAAVGTSLPTSNTMTIQLTGTGVAPAYAMSINPAHMSTITFGDVPVATVSSSQRVTIQNIGAQSFTASGVSTGSGFQITPVGGALLATQPLAPNASASYDVVCAPTSAGSTTGSISFTTPGAQGGLSRSVDFTCTGIMSNVIVAPSPASFARTLVGVPPPNIAIRITSQLAPTMIDSIALETGGEVAFVMNPGPTLLAIDGFVDILLSYTAATEHLAGRIDTLLIRHGANERRVTINAETLIGEIGVTPAVVDFGPVCPGSERSQMLMVYATASSAVELKGVTTPLDPFTVTDVMGTLEPNHGNIIELEARVAATGPGTLADRFILRTNLPGEQGMHEVAMSGVALPPGVTPTPSVVHFGPNPLAATTTAKRVTVSNCGTGPLQVTGARLEGASAEEFVIVSPETPVTTIPMMGDLDFLVVMTPKTTGPKAAQLVVTYEGGEVRADLDGNAFGATTDDDEDKGTYYTCSAGGAAGSLPLGFSILALWLRRRRVRA